MGQGYYREDYSRKPKWGLFLLLMFSVGVIIFFLIVGMRGTFHVSNKRSIVQTIEGTLDYDTGNYLEAQGRFAEKFYSIIATDDSSSGSEDESESAGPLENLEWMKNELSYMKRLDVADSFSDYKKEVDYYYTNIVSSLEDELAKDHYDTSSLSSLYYGFSVFNSLRTDDLPALFDELGVEYTIKEDEDGEKIINYQRTVISPQSILD